MSDMNAVEAKRLRIDVVSDAVCPWCWIGKRNLEAALASLPQVEVDVHWRAYQLDPTIPPGGADRKAYLARKFGDRVDEIYRRIGGAGREVGIDFRFDQIARSPNTLDAHRLIRWSWAAGAQDAIVESLFRAFFAEGLDIGDREVLTARAEAAGMDGDLVRRLLASDADAEPVRAEVEGARELGVTGVPFFIINERMAVSGAQPSETLARVMRKALDRASTAA